MAARRGEGQAGGRPTVGRNDSRHSTPAPNGRQLHANANTRHFRNHLERVSLFSSRRERSVSRHLNREPSPVRRVTYTFTSARTVCLSQRRERGDRARRFEFFSFPEIARKDETSRNSRLWSSGSGVNVQRRETEKKKKKKKELEVPIEGSRSIGERKRFFRSARISTDCAERLRARAHARAIALSLYIYCKERRSKTLSCIRRSAGVLYRSVGRSDSRATRESARRQAARPRGHVDRRRRRDLSVEQVREPGAAKTVGRRKGEEGTTAHLSERFCCPVEC